MKRILVTALLAGSSIAARAEVFQYSVSLDGPSDGTASPGTGSGSVEYDDVLHTLALQVSFSGLVTTGTGTTVSHIHAPTVDPFTGFVGVATTTPTFVGFPTGVTSGTYANTLDLTLASSFNSSFVTANGGTVAGAEAALAGAMASGRSYWNIHSSTFPGGEIRGFLEAVPEPSTFALAGLGIVAIASAVRRRKAS
jgi:hypothetical protein